MAICDRVAIWGVPGHPVPLGTEPPQAPLSLPWPSGGFAAVKGVLYSPAPNATMTAETSEALLAAIAKARGWIADLVAGRAADFAQIAQCEGKVRAATDTQLR